jgi:bifunctional non-homologous end joining protein LigD
MNKERHFPWKDLQPMLATLSDGPFDDPQWIYETKFDGFRMICEIIGGRVTLYSRSGKTLSGRYVPIAKALEMIKIDCVLDGELVALDSEGRSRFQLLQNALREKTNLRYYVFDCMFVDGKDVRKLQLLDRKKILKELLPKNGIVRYSEHHVQKGTELFEEAKERGEEGIIAKRANSPYHSGARSEDWLKIKAVHEEEAVIVGFTEPRRSRKYFGSLLLAVHENDGWRYVGNVGTGFDTRTLRDLYEKLSPLKSEKPFHGRTKYDRTATWVKPELVAEVKFTEWTNENEMRHPVYLGLRDDKKPEEVIMEKAAHV